MSEELDKNPPVRKHDSAVSDPSDVFASFRGVRCLVSGHTGFKGSWLSLWLALAGAQVIGISLEPITQPNLFTLAAVRERIARHITADIRGLKKLLDVFRETEPEVVFHLAAQPLVGRSYQEPVYTLETNVLGTAHILEACRWTDSVRAVVVVTSDKCYENREWLWSYRESDTLGGHDLYSVSKACSELIASAYRRSFFSVPNSTRDRWPTSPIHSQENRPLVATARAGNVIGGGDWAADRIIPDLVRGAASGTKAVIRSPGAVRPWQHVLDPLYGYLLLGRGLLEGNADWAQAWNFGPEPDSHRTVLEVLEQCRKHWKRIEFTLSKNRKKFHETRFLSLDSSRARRMLGWKPRWNFEESVKRTLSWYRLFYEEGQVETTASLKEYSEQVSFSSHVAGGSFPR